MAFTPKPSNHYVPPLAYTNLPAVKQIPLAVDPNSYSRPGSAPMIPADKGPSNMGPVLRPGYPVK
jgi:hypothetical protein